MSRNDDEDAALHEARPGRSGIGMIVALLAGLLADLLLAGAIVAANGGRMWRGRAMTPADDRRSGWLFIASVLLGALSAVMTATMLAKRRGRKWQFMAIAGVIAYWAAFVCAVIAGAV